MTPCPPSRDDRTLTPDQITEEALTACFYCDFRRRARVVRASRDKAIKSWSIVQMVVPTSRPSSGPIRDIARSRAFWIRGPDEPLIECLADDLGDQRGISWLDTETLPQRAVSHPSTAQVGEASVEVAGAVPLFGRQLGEPTGTEQHHTGCTVFGPELGRRQVLGLHSVNDLVDPRAPPLRRAPFDASAPPTPHCENVAAHR